MDKEEKKTMNRDEFRELAQALMPHFSVISDELQEHLDEKTIPRIDICGDGYIRFEIYMKNESWCLSRVRRESDAKIIHECRESFNDEEMAEEQ